jgi:hypothetical protein
MEPDIDKKIEHHTYWKGKDGALASAIQVIALLTSSFTGIAVFTEKLDKITLGVLAFIPALALGLDKLFRWGKRSAWHFEYRIKLLLLKDELENGKITPQELKTARIKLEQEMEPKWPGFGESPGVT